MSKRKIFKSFGKDFVDSPHPFPYNRGSIKIVFRHGRQMKGVRRWTKQNDWPLAAMQRLNVPWETIISLTLLTPI